MHYPDPFRIPDDALLVAYSRAVIHAAEEVKSTLRIVRQAERLVLDIVPEESRTKVDD